MTIKMIARRPWPTDEHRYSTWYEPFDEQRLVNAAITWLLDGHPEVTGLATAGETALLGKMVEAEKARASLSVEEAKSVLDELGAGEYESPFEAA
jgi:hypothetical protein